jgi:peptide deformylase
MALRKILTYPHPILKQKASPVKAFDEELEKLLADMAETMYEAPGIGLAANQIGVPLQVVVIDISRTGEENELIELINPRITPLGEECETDEEGCLSVVDLCGKVKRFLNLCVTAQDRRGHPLEFEAEGLLARVIQHEVDHLHGKLFLDHLSSLKRALYKKRRKKQLLQEGEAA